MENTVSILFCLTLFYVATTTRIKAYVTALRIQGILIAVMLVTPFLYNFNLFGFILPASILLIKVIIVPRYINMVIVRLDIRRRVEPTIQQILFLPLVIATMTLIFILSHIISQNTALEVIPFASGFSAIVTGIYLIMFRKKLIVHTCGFLILENGIFLIGTAIASELPVMIELGMLLDVFVVVFLMGIALNRIRSTFENTDVTDLGRLKD